MSQPTASAPVPATASAGVSAAVAESNARLWAAIDSYYAAHPDPAGLRDGVARALLLIPVRTLREMYTVREHGMRWILAFSSHDELARFAHLSGRLHPPYWHITMRGQRLLDHYTTTPTAGPSTGLLTGISASVGRLTGIALDISGNHPMLIPPLFNLAPATASKSSTSHTTAAAPAGPPTPSQPRPGVGTSSDRR